MSWEDYVAEKYPTSRLVPLQGGGTNELYLLDGVNPKMVLKISTLSADDVESEFNCLALLAETGMAPQVYDFMRFDDRVALLMEYCEGPTFLEVILANQKSRWAESIHLFHRMGKILARLHSIPVSESGRIRFCYLERMRKSDFDKQFIWPRLREESYRLLADTQLDMNSFVLTHGDFGYHNIIARDEQPEILIDWEFCEINDPISDVASLFFWCHLHFPEHASTFCEALVDSYLCERHLDLMPERLKAFCIYRIGYILFRVTDAFPDFVKTEWNRRLDWALQHDFI